MRKCIVFILILTCVLGLVGCSSNKIDKTKPVFETENISRITFYSVPDGGKGFEVPSEYIDEITIWLGSFTIDEKADSNVLAPGSNSVSVQIEYSDGSVIENGLSTIKINGIIYYMKHEDAPECYLQILSQTEPE